MEFETRKRTEPAINLTALIDIVFILVIFVVLGANFHHIRAMDVSIPTTDSDSLVGKADPGSLIITIPVSGPVNVQGRQVTLDDLRGVLGSLKPGFNSVLLMSDRSVSVQRAIKILGDAQAVGFKSVSVATQNSTEHHAP